jgi:uncharacterized protein (TIGR00730 family)
MARDQVKRVPGADANDLSYSARAESQRPRHRPIRRICVFSGSSPGRHPCYAEAAAHFGTLLARERIGLVYGGASVGLMGTVADAARAAGGDVIGVIPQGLVEREVAHTGLDDLRVVGSMHERKALMAELSDGFVALPGGIGTFEEIFEVWTWGQLGSNEKPCAFLNVGGFYDRLLTFLDYVVEEAFLKRLHLGMILVEERPDALLDALRRYESPAIKWIERDER